MRSGRGDACCAMMCGTCGVALVNGAVTCGHNAAFVTITIGIATYVYLAYGYTQLQQQVRGVSGRRP